MERLFQNQKDLKQYYNYLKKELKLKRKKNKIPYLTLCLKIIDFLETTIGKENVICARMYMTTGRVYQELNDGKNAIQYFEQAEKLLFTLNMETKQDAFVVWYNLSDLYDRIDHRRKCFEYRQKMSEHPKLPMEYRKELEKVGIL